MRSSISASLSSMLINKRLTCLLPTMLAFLPFPERVSLRPSEITVLHYRRSTVFYLP